MNKILFLVSFLFCFNLHFYAIEPEDSTVYPKEHVPNERLSILPLLADVPNGDPKVQSDNTIPQWVVERISIEQKKLIEKFFKGKKHTDYMALLAVLADSALTNQYFERFKPETTDSAIWDQDRSFEALTKNLPPHVSYVSLPRCMLDYPIASTVEDCQLCSYRIYSPVNGDDIHLVLDILYKKGIDDSYKIVGQYVRLTGKLSDHAIWASNTGTRLVNPNPCGEEGYGMFKGCIAGYLSYFKDEKPKQVAVNFWFTISPK